MTEPNTTQSQRIAYAQRAWVAITIIQSVMHNIDAETGYLPHWQSLVMYLERATDTAKNLERTNHANKD